ncbi:MAG: sigma-54 dependent transcriptional regulator, partial [Planctomycetota bacterium]
ALNPRDDSPPLEPEQDDASHSGRSLRIRWQALERQVNIVARSPGMRAVLHTVNRLAESTIPILIEGESGTGKELVASVIHRLSRRAGPLVTENCGAIPDSLVESELFGYEKGAFTGAEDRRPGLFERADGGTLFLDEVGEMKPDQQKKLLRVLQERRVRRLGGRDSVPVNFRLVSATHRDLEAMARDGLFREDLFYRIQAATVTLPPLRDRRQDILPLVEHFRARYSQELGRNPEFSPEALRTLEEYEWPGNVRELQNEIWRLVCATKTIVRPIHIRRRTSFKYEDELPAPDALETLAEVQARSIVPAIERTLRATGGNVAAAARVLEIPRTSLYRLIQRFGIDQRVDTT